MAEESAPLNVAQLVADHHQALYRYAYRLTGSVPDAEDLTQQVFLSAHQNLSQVRQVETVRSWLFTILRNAFLKSRRQRVPVPLSSIDYDLDSIPEEIAPLRIDSERLQAVLNRLPDEFKIVVLMFYFEHASYREIAEKLEIPLGTVMSRLARAKAHLRRELGAPDESIARKAVAARPPVAGLVP